MLAAHARAEPFHSVQFNPADSRLVVTSNNRQGIALWDVRRPRKIALRLATTFWPRKPNNLGSGPAQIINLWTMYYNYMQVRPRERHVGHLQLCGHKDTRAEEAAPASPLRRLLPCQGLYVCLIAYLPDKFALVPRYT